MGNRNLPGREKKKPSQSKAGEWCDGAGHAVVTVRYQKRSRSAGTEVQKIVMEASVNGKSLNVRCPECNRRLTAKIVACCPRGDPGSCGHLEIPKHKRTR